MAVSLSVASSAGVPYSTCTTVNAPPKTGATVAIAARSLVKV